ncbi:pyridoxal-phosphate dependent enzyme [Maritalea sp.]|uniref:pyridoxal-phosphate dependent enzyme n=1 Tax=Maritalea sp. TaxID=2003361 RepID=UPI003EF98209
MINECYISAANSVRARKRIAPHIYETPCLPSQGLGDELGCELHFKAENFQHTGSFKLRGALSKLTTIDVDQRVVTASSGNHGIASSYAASILGHKLSVYLPVNVSKQKLERIKSFGVEVVVEGDDAGHSEVIARAAAEADPTLTYISPYNDTDIFAGQGTIGLEMLEQVPHVDNVFISLGGGGLVSGIGSVLKAFGTEVNVVGVSAKNSAALNAAINRGEVIDVEHKDTLADGVAGAMDVGSLTLPIASNVIDELVVCDEDEIASCLRLLARKEHQIVEGAAALALAGLVQNADKYKNQTNIVLLCGANFDDAKILPLI